MKRRLLIAATTALLLGAVDFAAAHSAPLNFGVVVPQGIYRGGQPSGSELKYLKELGVRTIVKLNHTGLDEERAEAERLGMKFVNLPLDASSVGQADSCGDVAAAVSLLSDRSQWPVYVHCSRGRDRTGFVVGAFRQVVERKAWASVDEELARYGHGASMRQIFPQISGELKGEMPACSDEIARALSRGARSAAN